MSDNNLVCIRGVLKNLDNLKKFTFKNNPDEFIEAAGGKSKAKKGKLQKIIEAFQTMPAHKCIYV